MVLCNFRMYQSIATSFLESGSLYFNLWYIYVVFKEWKTYIKFHLSYIYANYEFEAKKYVTYIFYHQSTFYYELHTQAASFIQLKSFQMTFSSADSVWTEYCSAVNCFGRSVWKILRDLIFIVQGSQCIILPAYLLLACQSIWRNKFLPQIN